jgi:thioredoxin-related protein
MKPIVDGIEQEYSGRLQVIRVNIQESAGRELAAAYNFEYTPTFIFFDAQGNERWRSVGSLDQERLQQSMQ